MKTQDLLKNHFKDDKRNFKKINEILSSQTKVHKQFTSTLKNIEEKIEKKPTPEEQVELDKVLDERMEAAVKKAIYGGSKWTYQALLVIAGVVGALLIIFGGFKSFLAWFGFSKI